MSRQWIAITVGALTLILFYTVFGERGLLHIHHLNREYAQLEKEMELLKRENDRLRSEIEALRSNREYLESIARREFGLVRQNEVIYRFMTTNRRGGAGEPEQVRQQSPPLRDVRN